jgi:predicted Zn finger-like uncharacterized protein
MIIQCPECQTKFNLPDEQFGEGAKARCSVCSNVFELHAPGPEETGLDESHSDLFADETMEGEIGDEEDLFAEEGPEGEPEDAGEGAGKEDFMGEEGQTLFDIEKGKKRKKPAKGKKQKKGGSRASRVVLVLLVLLAVAGGAYYYGPQLAEYLPFWPGEPEGGNQTQAVGTDEIKNFALQDVRQYYVKNEKIGQVFVIQGDVVNNFETAKEFIKVEASLYDENGVAVESKTRLIGNTVSLFQLQMLTKEELKAALTNEVGLLTNNTNVPPGGSVSFVIVFYNPPETVQEFGVKVVEAKNPPPEEES